MYNDVVYINIVHILKSDPATPQFHIQTSHKCIIKYIDISEHLNLVQLFYIFAYKLVMNVSICGHLNLIQLFYNFK